jgi:hypothetical protein
MPFFLAIYFLNDATKKPFATVQNTTITDGTKRDHPLKYYVGKTFEFFWGAGKAKKATHLAKVLFARKS